MKNIALIIALICSFALSAQDVTTFRMSPAIGTGLSFPSYEMKNARQNFNGGLRIELSKDLQKGGYFASELKYVTRPYRSKWIEGDYGYRTEAASVRACPGYIELPVLFGWRYLKYLSFEAGPYFGYGVYGSVDTRYVRSDGWQKDVKRFCFSDGGGYKRFEVGWRISYTCTMPGNGGGIAFTYDQQFNRSATILGHHLRNRSFSVSWIGFLFAHKKK